MSRQLNVWPGCFLAAAGLVVAVGNWVPAADKESAKESTPKVVKFNELKDAIRGHKGKTVVVDLWQDTWLSCKKEFPHLVQMHKKYAKEGLVAISVNLDDPADKEAMQKVREFLKEQKVTFPSYVLNEAVESWQKSFGIGGPPTVFVFGRDGKAAKKYEGGEVDYQEIEKQVTELLKKKE